MKILCYKVFSLGLHNILCNYYVWSPGGPISCWDTKIWFYPIFLLISKFRVFRWPQEIFWYSKGYLFFVAKEEQAGFKNIFLIHSEYRASWIVSLFYKSTISVCCPGKIYPVNQDDHSYKGCVWILYFSQPNQGSEFAVEIWVSEIYFLLSRLYQNIIIFSNKVALVFLAVLNLSLPYFVV